jgi:hypothetical protein
VSNSSAVTVGVGYAHTFAVEIKLSVDDRARLEAWARRRTSAQGLAERSRIVLAAAEGLKNAQIARALVSTVTRFAIGAGGLLSSAWMGCGMSPGGAAEDDHRREG